MAYTGPYIAPATVLLSTQTASNSASIAFDSSLITSTYSTFQVIISNVYPVTDADELNLDISTDNGSTYLNSGFSSGDLFNDYNSTTLGNNNSTTTFNLVTNQSNNTSDAPICGYIDLYSLPSTNAPACVAQLSYFISGGTFVQSVFSGQNTSLTAINNIKFSFAGGNISSGTFSLYGVFG